MKIAVLGAGAVGCYYGGLLARAGNEVTLIGRPAHVAAVAHAGLLLETGNGGERIAVHASTEVAAARGADLVLFCVKSIDTASAGRALAPYVTAATVVLAMQNGVDNVPRLQALLAARVVAAVVYVATEMAGPGHVRHHGRGDLVIGPPAEAAGLVPCLGAAGIAVRVSDNVAGELWAKLIINCAYNALSAIAQLPYGRLVQVDGVEATMGAVVQECLAVAQADGVRVPGDIAAAVRAIAGAMPAQLSSTAQDIARRRRTEIDHLNGHVVARGRALDVPTPVNAVLATLVRLLESGASAGA